MEISVKIRFVFVKEKGEELDSVVNECWCELFDERVHMDSIRTAFGYRYIDLWYYDQWIYFLHRKDSLSILKFTMRPGSYAILRARPT